MQSLTTFTRSLSSLATAGFGNPIFSTLEAGASIGLAILAIVLPLATALLLLVLLYIVARKAVFRKKAVAEAA